MNLPNYMAIICNLRGDVIQKPDDLDIKTIFEIVNEQSLPDFHEYIKTIFKDGKYIKVRKLKLVNDTDYYLSTEILNSKIVFHFDRCDKFDPTEESNFWMETIYKYDYYLQRSQDVIIGIAKLIQNFLYKQRSDIFDIVKDLHNALKIEHSLVLFRNGHDHILYCKDNIASQDCRYIKDLTYLDAKFDENIVTPITDILHIKKYKDSYIKEFVNDDSLGNKNVYVLKLVFGPKTIGYFEFIPYSHILLTPVELTMIQSLSSILAYIINNKNEQANLESYIKEKFQSFNKL